jgi:GH25 family lysozyme M1 (1,4-beta-N-acetylmuramidase)
MTNRWVTRIFCTTIAWTSSSELYAAEQALQRARDLSGVMADLHAGNKQFILDESVRDKDRIEFVMHRFLLGHYKKKTDIDEAYRTRADQSLRLKISFGAYHVMYLSRTGDDTGAEQAKNFLELLRDPAYCNPGQQLLLAVDWEETFCYRNGVKHSCGTPDPKYFVSFLNYVNNATGKKVLVYAGANVLSKFSNDLRDETARATFTRNPLWLAQHWSYYRRGEKDTVIKTGFIFPQDEDIGPWDQDPKGWTFWQFTEGKGKPPTHATPVMLKNQPVDLSWFNGSRDEFREFYKRNAVACDAIVIGDKKAQN